MNFTLISILVFVIIFISTLIRSAFGFGNALIAMPLLVLILGIKTATPLVAMIGIVIALVMLLREWRELDFKDAIYLILSTLAGIPLGLFFLSSAPEQIVRIILGLILIGFS
ncbi:MAG: sulfite exporter TauE/SafE family protein, partial [Anaerolineales bacterium]|nr:sulfite exporter TauE/SafE family protein [Anaerolineales bacterium]